ncbi:MAG TPA: DNA translocase FtsK [Bacilli bacterium]
MGKRKKNNKAFNSNLKLEVYGILILIFSIISLAGRGSIPGMGSVGRSLSHIFLYLAGQWYFIVPLLFIYIGLHLMIKREWPKTWSHKKTGLVLLVLGLLTLYHINLFQLKDLADVHSAGKIISQPFTNTQEYLRSEVTSRDIQEYKRELGGGQIGALFYAFLYLFFDDIGSRFIVYCMFALSFMFLTGLSYVDIGKRTKGLFSGLGTTIRELIADLRFRINGNGERAAKGPKSNHREVIHLAADDEIDEENYNPAKEKVFKKRSFLKMFQSKDTEESRELEEDAYMEEDPYGDVIIQSPQGAPIPLIRNFQDHADLQMDILEPLITIQSKELVKKPVIPDSNIDEELIVIHKPSAKPYQLPPFNLLSRPASLGKNEQLDYKANARKLEMTLESFGVRAKVMEVVRGPSITRYEIQPDVGVKVSRIVSLTDDIALALAAKDIRMEAPIPGKAAIGIEVPNTEVSIVTMREVMETSAFHESSSKLSIVFGIDISGQPIVGNLARMPHLLVAGATGSGKSVCINGIITSILYKAKPDEVKFLMIDPKMVELNTYNGIPHLLAPVVTDPRRASLALKKVVQEMEKRYELFSKSTTRNIEGYNTLMKEKGGDLLPFIVVIVDELADLMMVAANDVEDAICRLAQMARASGIHLIIATQRPSVDVITGLIKANIPSRIAFGVSSQVDSRTILDMVGAEKLLGRGDMLFLPVGASKPVRVQGAFLSDQEVEAVVTFVRNQGKAEYQEDLVPEVEEQMEMHNDQVDELYDQAVQIVVEAKQASVSLLQRRMRVGYTRAARLIDYMEAKGVVGPYEGSKPREVLVTLEQFHHNRITS